MGKQQIPRFMAWATILFAGLVSENVVADPLMSGSPLLPGVAAAGYGYASSAYAEGLEALYWNPATLINSFRSSYTLSLLQDPAAVRLPVTVGQLGFLVPKRAAGVWAGGLLSFRDSEQHVLQSFGYAKRFHSLFKVGVALYHDNFVLRRWASWGYAVGCILRPAHWLRIGLVARNRAREAPWRKSLRNRQVDLLRAYSTGISLGTLSPLIALASVDWSNRRTSLGIGYRPKSAITLKLGFSTFWGSRIYWRSLRTNSRLHFGFSLGGSARVQYALGIDSKGAALHTLGFKLSIGRVVRQIRLRPKIVTLSPVRPVGAYATYKPELQYEAPREVLVRTSRANEIGELLEKYGSLLEPSFRTEGALRAYNGLADSGMVPPGTTLRLPLNSDSPIDTVGINLVLECLGKSQAQESAYWPSWQLTGLASLLLGREFAAESQLGKARTLAPNSGETNAAMAQLYIHRNHPEKAAELQEQVVLREGRPVDWANLGIALELSGQHLEAIRAFEKADSLGYESPLALLLSAQAYLRLGQLVQGKQKLQHLMEKYEQSRLALEARALLDNYRSGTVGADVVTLVRAVTCRAVGHGPLQPRGITTEFPDVGRVYLYVEVSRKKRSGIHIQPAWYREGELVFRSLKGWRLGASNRTYGYKTMHGKMDRGNWRVELRVKETGQFLGQIRFSVGTSEDKTNE